MPMISAIFYMLTVHAFSCKNIKQNEKSLENVIFFDSSLAESVFKYSCNQLNSMRFINLFSYSRSGKVGIYNENRKNTEIIRGLMESKSGEKGKRFGNLG